MPWCSDVSRHLDGVYKAGFAVSQEPYLKAVHPLFESLDRIEKMLEGKDYLVGDRLTEADVRLFVTVVSHLMYAILMLLKLPKDPFRSCILQPLQV